MHINLPPFLQFLRHALNPIVVIGLLLLLAEQRGIALDGEYLVLAALVFLLVIQILEGIDLEPNFKQFVGRSIAIIFVRWFLIVALLALVGCAAKILGLFDRDLLVSWTVATPFVLVAMQQAVRFLYYRLYLAKHPLRKAVIVGVNDLSLKLADRLQEQPMYGVSCLGFFDDRSLDRLKGSKNLLGGLKEVTQYVKQEQVNVIYISLPITAQSRIHDLFDSLRDTTVSIYYLPDVFTFDLIQAKTLNMQGIPMIALCESPFDSISALTKRFYDFVLSLLILVVLSPLLLIIAVSVKLSSPGPVLFQQRRYGLDGEQINVYKFRSMTVCENGTKVTQATRNDPRITRVGAFLRRTSLDELPQFINVLQGRMSIVGPRPHAVAHNETYRKLIKGYMVRHKVLPGITGWAQVNGSRGETETVEKMRKRIEYDLDYLRNWSVYLDFLIILRTVGAVINDKNAY